MAIPSHFNPLPPWVVLATIGPDESGTEYAVVRMLNFRLLDLGSLHRQLPGLGGGVVSEMNTFAAHLQGITQRSWKDMVVLAILAHPKSGQTTVVDMLGIYLVHGHEGQHWLGDVFFMTQPKEDTSARWRGIWLWTLTEVFGFSFEQSIFSGTLFAFGVPEVVEDGAVSRLKQTPLYQEVDGLLQQWLELTYDTQANPPAGVGARLEFDAAVDRLVQDIALKGQDLILLLEDELSPAIIGVDDPDTFPMIHADNEIAFQLDVNHREPVAVLLHLPWWKDKVQTPCVWDIGDDNAMLTLAQGPDLAQALADANLIVEESRAEQWVVDHIDRWVPNAQVTLQLDIEPYLLLDTPTPYLWPDDDFIRFLRQEGML